MKEKKQIIIILIVCLAYNFLINCYHRHFIYYNKIDDYSLADIGNNIIFIPSCYFLYYLIKGKFIFSNKKDIYFHTLLLSGVEILSKYVPYLGTFDIKDIIGLMTGASLTYALSKKIIHNIS